MQTEPSKYEMPDIAIIEQAIKDALLVDSPWGSIPPISGDDEDDF